MIRVLLVEPQPLARAGLRKIIESSGDLGVPAEADDAESALRVLRVRPIDITVLGVRAAMPAMAWLCRLQAARSGRLVCVIASEAEHLARHLLDRGVRGLLGETSLPEEAFDCIRRVHTGHLHLSAPIARRLALGTNAATHPFDKLSAREWQVMLMMTQGESTRCISRSLCLSPKTVSTYRSRILQKLGVRSDLEVLRLAIGRGLLGLNELGPKQ
ncbi:MAG: LuxR C-terminal-related transcriptional regulator [Gammaproteobacteria bacterium]